MKYIQYICVKTLSLLISDEAERVYEDDGSK